MDGYLYLSQCRPLSASNEWTWQRNQYTCIYGSDPMQLGEIKQVGDLRDMKATILG